MAKRKLTGKLINRSDVDGELRIIPGSKTDYVTEDGRVFKDYGEGKMFPKRTFVNKHNGYVYCGITYPEGQKQRRVHILVAEAYLSRRSGLSVVLHMNNDKKDNRASNLKWGTVSENTMQAYEDGLLKNATGWNDSQSKAIICYDMNSREIGRYGSAGEASRALGVTKAGILYQCKHKLKKVPKKKMYFRFLNDMDNNGFVL